MSDFRLLVLGTASAPTFAVYHFLRDRFGVERLILEQPESRSTFMKRRIKKLGPVRVAGQLAFQAFVTPALRMLSSGRIGAIQEQFQLRVVSPEEKNIARVQSVNSAETIWLLQNLAPDAMVLAGTRILSKNFLNSFRCPILNIHAGITPLYRGVHGAYWALVENRPELCGVTVHRVDAGIDTGEVLAQKTIAITPRDSFVTYPWLQLGEGLNAMADALPKVLSGQAPAITPKVTESKLRHHPTAWGYAVNRVVRGVK